VVHWPPEDDPADKFYEHYWAYAVIRRGATSDGLFDIPGQTPMRVTYDPFIGVYEDDEIDWNFVSRYFDYIWSYNDDGDRRSINEIADEVFREGPLILYQVRR
jgi:hypothetical protein